MTKKNTKKFLAGLGVASLFLLNYSPASALTLDLTTDPYEGEINGGLFSVVELNPAGTGYIEPFIRLQATGSPAEQYIQEGTNFNDDLYDRELDEKPSWISVFQITEDNLYNIAGQNYLNFILDVDEPASKESIELTRLILYTSPDDDQYPYPDPLAEPDPAIPAPVIDTISTEWDMDVGPDGDSSALLDYTLISGGSGWWGDLSVLIPVEVDVVGDYFYLYSAFAQANNNPEEWSIVSSAAPVPEPATMLLFGTGLVALGGYRRRLAKKK